MFNNHRIKMYVIT